MKGLEGEQKKLEYYLERHREPATFLKDRSAGRRGSGNNAGSRFKPVEAYGGILEGDHCRDNYNSQCRR